jgi:hypothetical protein
MKNDKNQVYTRALHAEENAFLQISKYGGTQVKGGYLFTTASPCELCAKKAYQLGIKSIYYIDPYPGISQSHVLNFGKDNNPKMKLFYGAIGQAYLDFYEPRMAVKDELELLTGVDVKKAVKGDILTPILKYGDIRYKEIVVQLKFDGDRNSIESTRTINAILQKDGINRIKKQIVWTGSAYDQTKIIPENSDADVSLVEVNKDMPYVYEVVFDKEKKSGDSIKYQVMTTVKDEKHVMEPYLAHMVKNDTEKLIIKVITPSNLIYNVVKTIYADLEMKTKIKEIPIEKQGDGEWDIYSYEVENANVNYAYSIEWEFVDKEYKNNNK